VTHTPTQPATAAPEPVAPADTAGREAARARARALTSLISRNGAVAVLILVVVLGTLLVPSFGSADNLRNTALSASFIGIIAAGMTFVIISGGIDLSVGSTYALAVILSASLAPQGSFVAVAGALGAAALAGLVQGLIISQLQLPPFIVTLAGLTGIRGLVFLITHEGNDHPSISGFRAFETLGTGKLATIGTPVWIMLVVFAVGWWALNRTPFGQSVQAVGGNESAAELMGLPVKRTTTIVYVVSGLCAGLAGVLTTALSGGGQEARIGDSYELSAIAAVVIGGTLLSGGIGSMVGTLAGVLLLFVIQNLIVQGANLNSYVQQVVSGAFLLVVVIAQAALGRRTGTEA
jgi:ribose/xylose/arabinose/galactoside ABC-type transport system permease subunit